MSERNEPDRALVLRIVTQEAEAAGVDPGAVLAMSKDRRSKLARRAAMRRIIAETGCSRSGLATVWGCDRQVVCRLYRPARRGQSSRWRSLGSRERAA